MAPNFYSVSQLVSILDAQGHLSRPDSVISTLSIDSRKLSDQPHALFFALKERRDGHAFIADVYEAGVRNFVVSTFEPGWSARYPDANFLEVENTLTALQKLAAGHRASFAYPVLAITGSNGKTMVKEWLFQLLSAEYVIVRSPKSYNSQIGVPLSVWQMATRHQLAIFETGISQPGEMEALERVIAPDIGILTNIGPAHDSGFSSRQQKISEKLKLFARAGCFIYSPYYLRGYTGPIPGKRKFTWSLHGEADLTVAVIAGNGGSGSSLKGRFREQEVTCHLPFSDAAAIENAVICWAVMLSMDHDFAESAARLEKLQPVRMRLELKTGINQCSVIDDSYSLDSASLAIALDFLNQQNQHPVRTLILSDLPETGGDTRAAYRQVAALIASKSVNRLVGIGREISAHHDEFPPESRFFASTDDFLSQLDELRFDDETILLKGARVFGFERISRALTQKVHETVLEINLNALEANLNFYKSKLAPGVKLMAMVKAFSYGSGSFEIANLLQFNKVDYLAVAFADEGVALRTAGIRLPIMVMNADVAAFETLAEHQLEPEIYSIRILTKLAEWLRSRGSDSFPVHLKLDTGMHRLGFMPSETDEMLSLLAAHPTIRVVSVFSHLVGSEDPAEDAFTQTQLHVFLEQTRKIKEQLGVSFLRHISNTSAISRRPDAQFDMVRLGIGLYGIDNVPATSSSLQQAVVLRTSISQIKQLEPGETVGYNRRGVLPNGGTIATVKIGYADGYHRKLGNGVGKMLLNGHPVPTIGSICMDMTMLNITGVDAREGDEVIVFNEEVTIEDMAAALGTIPYEVLTGISQRVKRVYFYE